MGHSLRKTVLGNDNDNIEMLSIVWLDASVNTTPENLSVQEQLRKLINNVKTFDNSNEFLRYIDNTSKIDRIILIVSGRLGRTIVPHVHHLRQIISIYIYCMDKQANEQWSKDFTKVL